jgi:hypothetical protein|tara:strand:- start:1210 stop:1401 length:192 start_codon:yes stop_codon:yes gene_type:complete
MKKTPSRITKSNSKRGCLCDDNTYHPDCCDGTIWAEGVGITQGQTNNTITNTATERNNTNTHG